MRVPSLRSAPVLALAFRPFFLAGSLFASFVILQWGAFLRGLVPVPPYFAPSAWHAHEMLFGFVAAILAGFLLTASGNWAQTRGAHGGRLLFLFLVWLAGRLAIGLSAWLPGRLVAALDLAFLPCLAAMLCQTLAKGGRKTNFAFVFWLIVLFVANLLMHFDALGLAEATARRGEILAVDTVVVIMVIMGGRVIPLFTRNAIAGLSIVARKPVEFLALSSVAVFLVADFVDEMSLVTALAALVAGGASFARILSWKPLATLGRPVLWILHIGYLFVALGLLARGVFPYFVSLPVSIPLHLLTAGAMGVLILGMISRVALGHTGRPILVGPSMVAAYGLVIAGAMVRVIVPIAAPAFYAAGMMTAAVLWGAGFTIFFIVYWPILTRPRIDGREG